MNHTFEPQLQILPDAQKELWPQLANTRKLRLVLYGGTAIALHLGHRASVDFDFFTDEPLNKARIRKALPFTKESTVLQDEPNALTLDVRTKPGHVRISFFGSIRFGRVNDPLETVDGALQVASLEDLFANKLKVIIQRAEKKDYTDIAALLKKGLELSRALAAAEKMFEPEFQPAIALKALTFFKDGDLPTLNRATQNLLIAAATKVGDLPVIRLKDRTLTPLKSRIR